MMKIQVKAEPRKAEQTGEKKSVSGVLARYVVAKFHRPKEKSIMVA